MNKVKMKEIIVLLLSIPLGVMAQTTPPRPYKMDTVKAVYRYLDTQGRFQSGRGYFYRKIFKATTTQKEGVGPVLGYLDESKKPLKQVIVEVPIPFDWKK